MPVRSVRAPRVACLLGFCSVAVLALAAIGCGPAPGPAATPPATSWQPGPGADDAGRDGTPRGDVAPQPLVVPPLPDGTPDQLLAFVEKLQTTKVKPTSQEELAGYVQGIGARGVEAANRILATVAADDPNAIKASQLKLESLLMLSDFDESDAAGKEVETYAQTLAAGPTPALSRLGKRTLIMTAARKAFNAEDFTGASDLVARMADLLAGDPDDTDSVKLAGSLARALEQVEIPGRDSPAVAAYETFGPLLEKSGLPQIRKLGAGMAGSARRIRLPGHPMQIEGTHLDGGPFDPQTLAGKVVLVDLWATWCGPCLEEIPNIRAQYEKYHAQGFEVVAISLDDYREDLDAFLAERTLPWPILFSGKGMEDPVARRYGINGIPQLILIGRDGNVISVTARGERLGELLAGQFPAEAAAPADSAAGPAQPAVAP